MDLNARSAAFRRFLVLIFLLLGGCSISFQGTAASLANSWIRPGSGNWEDVVNWAQGQPGAGQDIYITNSGWKAVSVGANAALNFPQSMKVESILVSAPPDSFNLLLLNYAGYTTPLQARAIDISSNAALTILGSELRVTNRDSRMDVGGNVYLGDYPDLRATLLSIGTRSSGAFYLTNGNVSVGTQYVGGAFSGIVKHLGGYLLPNSMSINTQGQYYLSGGALGGSVDVRGGTLQQDGGLFNGNLRMDGSFTLNGGMCIIPSLALPSPDGHRADMQQNGGTNQIQNFSMGFFDPNVQFAVGFHSLYGGQLLTATTSIGVYGYFDQWGGLHQVQQKFLLDGTHSVTEPGWDYRGRYILHGGVLLSPLMELGSSQFIQYGGTNLIQGDLLAGKTGAIFTYYQLDAGWLICSNLLVAKSGFGGLVNNGGGNVVSNLLKISDGNGYEFDNGSLSAPYIQVESGGWFYHNGGDLTNGARLTLANGVWHARHGETDFGQLQLDALGGNDSRLRMSSTVSCVVRFKDSHTLAWNADATLTVEGWNGSLSGGGQNQFQFPPGGLTPKQIGQLRFVDPAGLPPGTYPARSLASGELVPTQQLQMTKTGNQIVVQWDPGWTLQTATNILGPFVDLGGAISPYTNHFTDPRRFFRLRQ